ncbi:hypothetical protein DPMN_104671 [Dreissena polymorpha]|uniref:Uncharacterized protein n=1 Tax=Dreissena polymorpha TaxID=45954 RepID=A0A9D4HDK0_DREPO|nr:hypothetical protein DPMN_104671 [Dreissena polymorpha]
MMHTTLKQKIAYNLTHADSVGINWAKQLPEYQRKQDNLPVRKKNVPSENDSPTSDDELNASGGDLNAGSDYLNANGDDLNAGGDDLNADSDDLSAGGYDLNAGGDDLIADGDDLNSGSDDLNVGGDNLNADADDLNTDEDDLNVGGDDMNAGGGDLSACGDDLNADGDDLIASGYDLSAGVDDLNADGDDLNACDLGPHNTKTNVNVVSAKRTSNSRDKNSPGIVIATLDSHDSREKVLKSKSALKDSPFNNIFIGTDRTKEERVANQNLRKMVKALNKGVPVSVRGNRVVLTNSSSGGSEGNNAPYNGTQSAPIACMVTALMVGYIVTGTKQETEVVVVVAKIVVGAIEVMDSKANISTEVKETVVEGLTGRGLRSG